MLRWPLHLVIIKHISAQGTADGTGPFIVSDEPADLGDADLAIENLAAFVVGAESFAGGPSTRLLRAGQASGWRDAGLV